jgi:hypothetical protein
MLAHVLIGGVHGETEIDADNRAAVFQDDLGEAAGAAPHVEDSLSVQLFERKREALPQSIFGVRPAGLTVHLGRAVDVPFEAEGVRIAVALDESRDRPHDGVGGAARGTIELPLANLGAGFCCGDHLQASCTGRTA